MINLGPDHVRLHRRTGVTFRRRAPAPRQPGQPRVPIESALVQVLERYLDSRAARFPAAAKRHSSPHASNGPTEAINGRLELRRNALGFTNLSHPLPLALTTAQRRTPHTRRCTLNYEEPQMF